MNNFNFRPVGQGLFYTGIIDEFKFVYDCGAISKFQNNRLKQIDQKSEPALIKSIDMFYDENKELPVLDFIAISHLHSDHVNGIPYLLKKFKVKKVFLPYLPSRVYQSFFFKSYLLINGLNLEIVDLLISAYLDSSEVDNILNIGEEDKEKKDIITKYYTISKETNVKIDNWDFHFFNHYDLNFEIKITSLEKSVKKLLLKNNCVDLEKALENDMFIKELKKVYIEIFGDMNQTSLILLHHPNFKRSRDRCQRRFICFENCHRIFSSLLTGDINFSKTKDLNLSVNKKILESNHPLGIVNLPHHGSYDNFIGFISNIKFDQSILVKVYGITNPYGNSFPNYKTIKYMNNLFNKFVIVNEYQGFEYFI